MPEFDPTVDEWLNTLPLDKLTSEERESVHFSMKRKLLETRLEEITWKLAIPIMPDDGDDYCAGYNDHAEHVTQNKARRIAELNGLLTDLKSPN